MLGIGGPQEGVVKPRNPKALWLWDVSDRLLDAPLPVADPTFLIFTFSDAFSYVKFKELAWKSQKKPSLNGGFYAVEFPHHLRGINHGKFSFCYCEAFGRCNVCKKKTAQKSFSGVSTFQK